MYNIFFSFFKKGSWVEDAVDTVIDTAKEVVEKIIHAATALVDLTNIINSCSSRIGLDTSDVYQMKDELQPILDVGSLSDAALRSMNLILESIKTTMDSAASCLDGLNLDRGLTLEAISVSLSVAGGSGVLLNAEIGYATEITSRWRELGFIGGCAGVKFDVSIGFDINLGFWRHLDDIPGDSWGVSLGFDLIPGTEIGAGVALILNDAGDLLGVVFSIGVGFGVNPVDLAFFGCSTGAMYGTALFGKL